ncbi:MAG: DNA-directed RNA polymerase subunit alpha [Candidatus Hatepunaea meridiana]|nr:DNA-directed RNA polymerase subunit alpha [Candidatus Hatepunaea meridiana]
MNGPGFQMPESIEVDHTSYSINYGKFIIQPLERGYGTTVGNAIRRVLLASLPGSAITSLRINGTLHEFTTIPGVKEDVTEIILALKGVKLKMLKNQVVKTRLQLKGPLVVTAGYLQSNTNEIEVLNPDHVVANLNEDADFSIELSMKWGRGYVPSEDSNENDIPIGTIALDAIYTPIERVNYSIEHTRVGHKTDYEKLILEVWTDGSITPDDALTYAGKILRDHIRLFINFEVKSSEEETDIETDEAILKIRRLLRKPVDELELSVRSANCLKEAKIRTIADLVSKDEPEMLKFKNFGRKSLNELSLILLNHDLHFGFDIEKYLGPEVRQKPALTNLNPKD